MPSLAGAMPLQTFRPDLMVLGPHELSTLTWWLNTFTGFPPALYSSKPLRASRSHLMAQDLYGHAALTWWVKAFTGFSPSLAGSMPSRAFRHPLHSFRPSQASRPYLIAQVFHEHPVFTYRLNAFTDMPPSLDNAGSLRMLIHQQTCFVRHVVFTVFLH